MVFTREMQMSTNATKGIATGYFLGAFDRQMRFYSWRAESMRDREHVLKYLLVLYVICILFFFALIVPLLYLV